jgi:hypothetical protein
LVFPSSGKHHPNPRKGRLSSRPIIPGDRRTIIKEVRKRVPRRRRKLLRVPQRKARIARSQEPLLVVVVAAGVTWY